MLMIRSGHQKTARLPLHALLSYIASLLLIIFLGSRLQFCNLNFGLLVTEIAFIALPAGIVLFLHRQTVDRKLFSIPTPRHISLAAVIGGCVTAVAVYKGILTRELLAGVDTSGVDVGGGIPFLLLAILAPLCEELLFRPVIQNGMARQWSNRTAVLLTALLFALFHLSLLRFAETFIIGCFAGIVFLKTRNLWCAVMVHFICNTLGPLLWRWAPHLALLLNPWTSIGLSGLALAGCYYLGDRSPAPLKGLRQRLKWAAFGALESVQRTHKRSRTVSVLTAGIVTSLMALLGYGHAMMMHHLGKGKLKSNYVVSEKDVWTIGPSNEIHAHSDLAIRKSPETYEDLIVYLPLQGATVQNVIFGDSDLPFSKLKPDEYRVDLSSHWGTNRSGTITLLWNFPLARLAHSDKGYRIPLRSLALSDSFSLELRITDGCGFRFKGGQRAQHLFSQRTDKPKIVYGSYDTMLVEGEPAHTGGAQQSREPEHSFTR